MVHTCTAQDPDEKARTAEERARLEAEGKKLRAELAGLYKQQLDTPYLGKAQKDLS